MAPPVESGGGSLPPNEQRVRRRRTEEERGRGHTGTRQTSAHSRHTFATFDELAHKNTVLPAL